MTGGWMKGYHAGFRFRNWTLDKSETNTEFFKRFPSLQYLQDSGCEIDGFKVWGSPWQPHYYSWAFQFPPLWESAGDEAEKVWDKIPKDTQILITHTPPNGILDKAHNFDEKQGCPKLRARLDALHDLRLHCFGHIHEAYGVEELASLNHKHALVFANAAINNLHYEPVNKPIVVDL